MGLVFVSLAVNTIVIFRLTTVRFRGKSLFGILIAANMGGFFMYWYKYGFSHDLLFTTLIFVIIYAYLLFKAKNLV